MRASAERTRDMDGPTGGNTESGPSMTRRTLIRTTGLGAATAAAGGAVVGPAAGQDLTSQPVWAPWTRTTSSLISKVSLAFGAADDIPGYGALAPSDAGDVSFHQSAVQAWEMWDRSRTLAENLQRDIGMIGSIYARDAVADAWQDNLSESEAKDAVDEAVDERTDTACYNLFVAKMANLLTLAYIVDAAEQSGDFSAWADGAFWAPTSGSYSGSGSLVDSGTGIEAGAEDAVLALPSGSTRGVKVAEFQAEWDSGDTWSDTPDNFLDAYNSSSGEFEGLTTDDGNTFSDDFVGITPSVPEHDLMSRVVADLGELAETWDAIVSATDTVKSNYDASFVTTLYSELDAGNITPDQLRGVEALAELKSGSTDISESRYKLALSSISDIPRPDPADMSHLEARVWGWSQQTAVVEPDGTRESELSDWIDGEHYTGQFFAEYVSANLTKGKRYLFNTPVVSARTVGGPDTADPPVLYLSDAEGSDIWSLQPDTSDASAVGYSGQYGPDFDVVSRRQIAAGNYPDMGDVALISAGDGSVIWSVDRSVIPVTSITHTDDSVVVVDADGQLLDYGLSDGSESYITTQYGSSSGYMSVIEYDAESDAIIGAVSGSPGLVEAVSRSDGSSLWSTEITSSTTPRVLRHPEGVVVAYDGGVTLLDPSDGSEVWSVTHTPSSGAWAAVCPTPDGVAVAGDSSGEVVGLDISDGSQVWSATSGASAGTDSLVPMADMLLLHTSDGAKHLLDASDGTQIRQVGSTPVSAANPNGASPLVTWDPSVDGYWDTYDGLIGNGTYHGTTGGDDQYEELYLHGEIAVEYMQDADGNEVEEAQTDTSDDSNDYGPPNYDESDNQSYAEYLDEVAKEQAGAFEDVGSPSLPSIPGAGGLADGLGSLKEWAWLIVAGAVGLFVLNAASG